MPNGAKNWVFTINMQDAETRSAEMICWGLGPADGPQGDWYRYKEDIKYLHFQEEQGEVGTRHLQGIVMLKKRYTLTKMKKFHKRAHWEIMRASPQVADAYTRKEETRVPDGMNLTIGEMPKREIKDRDDRLADAADELDQIKAGYKRPADVDSVTLMQSGFMQAYNALTADVLGPYRPELKIITLVGPPGTGKSYAIQKVFPNHGRCIYGNCGCWFQNPTAEVMVFEEFNGQIPLQRILQLLDPYPLALEVKGRMAPAMYKIAIITSNTSPDMWYPLSNKTAEDNADLAAKRKDAIHALWDRLGYNGGGYIPARKCGTYIEAPRFIEAMNWSYERYIKESQEAFLRKLLLATEQAEQISDEEEEEEERIADTQQHSQ